LLDLSGALLLSYGAVLLSRWDAAVEAWTHRARLELCATALHVLKLRDSERADHFAAEG